MRPDTLGWQTSLDVFSNFPRRCAHFWSDKADRVGQVLIDEETGEFEVAFKCPAFPHKIVEEECYGERCECCELVGFEDYIRLIGQNKP